MGDILAIPEAALRPSLVPAIFVEKRDALDLREETRQAQFVATIRRSVFGCMVAAIPNAGRRTRWEARKVKREGLHTGFPDTGVWWADGSALIEWKDGQKMPDPQQVDCLNWLHRRGHAVAVCRTPRGAFEWLRSVGAPIPEALI